MVCLFKGHKFEEEIDQRDLFAIEFITGKPAKGWVSRSNRCLRCGIKDSVDMYGTYLEFDINKNEGEYHTK